MGNHTKSMSYKIPTTTKYFVTNGSDLDPNIQYTKNMTLDQEGYLKLSPPFPRFIDSGVIPNYEILADGMKYNDGSLYKLFTSDKIYSVNLSDFTVTEESVTNGRSTTRISSWKGGSYNNRVYLGGSGGIYSFEASNGVFPQQAIMRRENTSTFREYIETFVNRNTLVGSAGSQVKQFTTADMSDSAPPGTASGQALTIPDNFEIMGMAYSNYRMGIATRNKAVGSAYFFVWDGSTADASQGFPINAEVIIDVIAYKNSWVIYTSSGQVLLFNGGGFDVLGTLPVYRENATWIKYRSSLDHGRQMYTDGEMIYFNVGSMLISNEDDSGLIKGFYSGIWCYDPKIQCIYHKYSGSNSMLYTASLTPAAGVYTSTSHYLETGDRVKNHSGKVYFAIKLTTSTFKLADTYDLAVAGTASSTATSGTHYWIKRIDWSQQCVAHFNVGAFLNLSDTNTLRASGIQPVFIGQGLNTKSLGYVNNLSIMGTVYDNIGSVTYYKIKSEGKEDFWNSIDLKYRKLTENDQIVVKYKIKDAYKQIAIGEAGDETPDNYVTWVNSTTFTISNSVKDLSLVEVGDEVEFFSGAGAGSTAHISSITLASGTWTVVLDEAIRGGESGNKSTCMFDTFKKLGVITKSNDSNLENQTNLPLAKSAKWIQIKIELRGNQVTVEDLIINNKVGVPLA